MTNELILIKDIVLSNDLMKVITKCLQNVLEQDQSFADNVGNDIVLTKSLDLIELILANDDCKNICIQNIKSMNGLDTFNRIKAMEMLFCHRSTNIISLSSINCCLL